MMTSCAKGIKSLFVFTGAIIALAGTLFSDERTESQEPATERRPYLVRLLVAFDPSEFDGGAGKQVSAIFARPRFAALVMSGRLKSIKSPG